MGSKLDPGKFDCYANAQPDEPMFILLARDVAAPAVVEAWAAMRVMLINAGLKPIDDMAMVTEARECALKMRRWRSHQCCERKDEAAMTMPGDERDLTKPK